MVRSPRLIPWSALLPTIVIVGLSIACFFVPIDVELLEQAGYAGVFVITLIATGALVLPIPYLAVIARAAVTLDPVTVALVAGCASAIGELTGYVLGRSGRQLLRDGRWLQLIRQWMHRRGFATITLAAFVPNPAFDAVGALAGAIGYPAWRFCLACFIGKTARSILIALSARGIFG